MVIAGVPTPPWAVDGHVHGTAMPCRNVTREVDREPSSLGGFELRRQCFIWPFSLKEPSVEAVDAIDNQKLGRDMGQALRKLSQKDANDLWEVVFRFI